MERLICISSIKHKNKLNIEYKGKTYFGGNQSWFDNEAEVFGGCGPVCAFNLINYYELDLLIYHKQTKESQLKSMYNYIRPTEIHKFIPGFLITNKSLPPTLGVRSLNRFKNKFIRFIDQEFKQTTIHNNELNIKEYRFNSSADPKSIEYIKSSLNANHPICFLNTFNDSKLYVSKQLPTGRHSVVETVEELLTLPKHNFITHWVLVTGLYQGEDNHEYYLECSTWGQVAYFKLSDFNQKLNWKTRLFPSGMLSINKL